MSDGGCLPGVRLRGDDHRALAFRSGRGVEMEVLRFSVEGSPIDGAQEAVQRICKRRCWLSTYVRTADRPRARLTVLPDHGEEGDLPQVGARRGDVTEERLDHEPLVGGGGVHREL